MNKQLATAAGLVTCLSMQTLAHADDAAPMVLDMPSDILTSDAPTGISDVFDNSAVEYFEQIGTGINEPTPPEIQEPELQIVSSPGSITPVPEPTSLTLLALGGLLLTRRRR